MSKRAAKTVLLLVTSLCVGCADHVARQRDPPPDVARPTPPRAPATTRAPATAAAGRVTQIALQRTGCFGSCPIYTMVIKPDGSLRFHGERFVQPLGDHAGRIAPSRFEELARYALDMNFMSLANEYSQVVTDVPTIYTTVTIDGQSKRVRDYGNVARQRVVAFEKMISDSLTGVTWDSAPQPQSSP